MKRPFFLSAAPVETGDCVIRKVTVRLLPLFFIHYAIKFLDRGILVMLQSR